MWNKETREWEPERMYWDGETILDWVSEQVVRPLNKVAIALEDFAREVNLDIYDDETLEIFHEQLLLLIRQAESFRDKACEKYPPVLEMEEIAELEAARKEAIPF